MERTIGSPFRCTSINFLLFVTLKLGNNDVANTLCFTCASKVEVKSSRGITNLCFGKKPIRYLVHRQLENTNNDHDLPDSDDNFNSTLAIKSTTSTTTEITKIVLHKVKETASHSGTFTSFRMVVEQFVKQMERSSERTFERVTEQAMERVAQRTLNKQTVQHTTNHALQRLSEKTLDRFGERVLERAGERVLERTGERVLERAGERIVERTTERAFSQIPRTKILNHSERAFTMSWNRCKRFLAGIYLGRSAVRIGRGLTIALPLIGGLFAIYLLQSDVRRVSVEFEKQQVLLDATNDKAQTIGSGAKIRRRSSVSAITVLLFFVATGIVDLIDVIIHFSIAYGLLLSQHGAISHECMERISFWCSILSVLFAIYGEIYSHRLHSRNSKEVAT